MYSFLLVSTLLFWNKKSSKRKGVSISRGSKPILASQEYKRRHVFWLLSIMPQPRVAAAYPVNLFSPNWYNLYAPLSRTSKLQVQLLFSQVQLFFSMVQLLFSRYISCPSEKKSCTTEKISCTWSMEVLLNGEEQLYQLRENKFTG